MAERVRDGGHTAEGEICAAEVGLAQVRIDELRSGEVGVGEIHARQRRAGEVGGVKVRVRRIRLTEIRAAEENRTATYLSDAQ